MVTTLTTVGFGDPAPTTAPRKIFTILYIFVGLGIIGGFLNVLTKHTFARRRRRGGPVKSRRARLKTRRALRAQLEAHHDKLRRTLEATKTLEAGL